MKGDSRTTGVGVLAQRGRWLDKTGRKQMTRRKVLPTHREVSSGQAHVMLTLR